MHIGVFWEPMGGIREYFGRHTMCELWYLEPLQTSSEDLPYIVASKMATLTNWESNRLCSLTKRGLL